MSGMETSFNTSERQTRQTDHSLVSLASEKEEFHMCSYVVVVDT